MQCKIVYDSPGRLRVRCGSGVFSKLQQSGLEAGLAALPGVISAKAAYANGGILLRYEGEIRDELLAKIRAADAAAIPAAPLTPIRQTDEDFKRDLVKILAKRAVMKLFLPSFLS